MKSMTGFGYSEYQDETIHITAEVKSYNNRYLDIIVNLPSYLSPLEPKVRGFISNQVARGRVEVMIKLRELQEDVEVILDEKAARSYAATLRKLAEVAGVEEERLLPGIVEMEGVLKLERNRDLDNLWNKIEPRLSEAFGEYQSSRTAEGARTKADIQKWLNSIIRGRREISAYAGEIEQKLKENLQSRFRELIDDAVDENRILAETAVMLVKYGINEELSRLEAHVDAFGKEIDAEGPCGKRLDFLCQELNREINTIGSKSTMTEVNQIVVQMKDAVENMREQLRNIE